LQRARLDRCDLTGARLWDIQRGGWSIKGVICERAYWDEAAKEVVEYIPGQFERLYSASPCIELFYEGGITKFELNTLPALLLHLANLRPNARIRLKSIEESGSGAKLSINLEESDPNVFEAIKAEAKQFQTAQLALREESRRTERLEIEKHLLLNEVFPRLLAAAGPQVHIAGAAPGMVIASGHASVHAQQTFNDLPAIRKLLDEVEDRQPELGLPHDAAERLEKTIRDVQAELQKDQPRHPVVSEGLKTVRDFVVGALGNAAGTALATNTWKPILDQLTHLASQFRWW